MRVAVRREQPVDQALQPVGLVHDHLGVLAHLGRFQVHLQQLRRAADAAQRVLDLVRQVADQLLVRLGLLDQPLLAVLAHLLLQRRHLQQHMARAFGNRHDHLHGNRLLRLAAQAGLETQGRVVLHARPIHGLVQQRGVGKMLGKIAAFEQAPRQPQRIFQRRVGKQHRAVELQHRCQRAQRIKHMVGALGALDLGGKRHGGLQFTGTPGAPDSAAGRRAISRRSPAMSL